MRIRVCFPDDWQRTECGGLVTVRAWSAPRPALRNSLMSRRVSWVGIVSLLLVLVTGSGPVSAQEPRRNMFDGLFGPPLRTPPSFSRPQATLPGTILLD